MKPNRMTSIIAKSVAVLAACAALNASAGTAPAKAPVPPPEPEPAALFDSIGATLDVGYDSRYYFRGLWFADNIVWSALNVAIPLIGGGQEDAGSLTWNVGAAYISTVETPFNGAGNVFTTNGFDYSELDLVTSLVYDAGFAKFGLQYQHYFYFDTYGGSTNGLANGGTDSEFGRKGNQELGLTVTVPVGALNLYFAYFYDFTVNGQYFQAGADYTIPVTDWLSIVPSIYTGYGIEYYMGANKNTALVNNVAQPLEMPSSGFTHLIASVAAPIKLTPIATLTPYVAWNHSFQARSGLNATDFNEVFGGVKLSVAF